MDSTTPKHQIYFCGSIRAGREDQPLYKRLVDHMVAKHGPVLTWHVAEAGVFTMEKHETEADIWKRDMAWLKQSTCVVAEVTVPSLGVGYELGVAAMYQLPTLCLFHPHNPVDGSTRKLSAMVAGDPAFVNRSYATVEEAIAHIDQFFASHPAPANKK